MLLLFLSARQKCPQYLSVRSLESRRNASLLFQVMPQTCVCMDVCNVQLCVHRQKECMREGVCVCVRLDFSLSTARISCGAKLHLALSLRFPSLSLTSHSHMTARNIPSFVGERFQHPTLRDKRGRTHARTCTRTQARTCN